MAKQRTFKSDISGQEFPINEKISATILRESMLALIRKDNPEFAADKYLSLTELNQYREKFIADALIRRTGELTELEKTVIQALREHSTLTDKIDAEGDLTFGQRIADHVASFGGSWTFIISFGVFLFLWILFNVIWLGNQGFDPYPFILLNLILSCIAALQAPVIMMSQNRQEEKDRERAKKDYMVNLKSELEIRILHEKVDHLIMHQQQELMEIQRVQIEMMNDILQRVGHKAATVHPRPAKSSDGEDE